MAILMLQVLLGLMICLIHTSGHQPELDQQWEQFKTDFDKNYADVEEEDKRREIWEASVQDIDKHNEEAENGQHSYMLGINSFADMMPEEFHDTFTGYSPTGYGSSVSSTETFECPGDAEIPDSVNWADQGKVTPAKSQGRCGSSWAFSATGALEGQQALKTGNLVSLSDQNLVDCVKGNKGCFGGSIAAAFDYIRDNGGIDTEESYTYVGQARDCKYDPKNSGATLSSWKAVTGGDEKALQCAVGTIGPISAVMHVEEKVFKYKSGVYSSPDCNGKEPNHAILIVGYGNEDGKDYWLIKNSWGKGWGADGYMKLERNVNMCSIAAHALFPVI